MNACIHYSKPSFTLSSSEGSLPFALSTHQLFPTHYFFTMADFIPQLPKQGKWSLGQNRFDEDGKNPKQLSVFIPEESIDAFARYLQNLRAAGTKTGKCYNYKTQQNEDVSGIYLNFKGKEGSDGAFGNINPVNNDPTTNNNLKF
jgi:hypothetical protein